MNWIKKLEKDTVYNLTDISDEELRKFLDFVRSLGEEYHTFAFLDFNYMRDKVKECGVEWTTQSCWILTFSNEGATKVKFENRNKIE